MVNLSSFHENALDSTDDLKQFQCRLTQREFRSKSLVFYDITNYTNKITNSKIVSQLSMKK